MTGAEQFDALAESYFEELLTFYPEWAMAIGDNRYNDQYPVDIGPDFRAALRAMYEIKREAASHIEGDVLDEDRRLSLDLLVDELDKGIAVFVIPII